MFRSNSKFVAAVAMCFFIAGLGVSLDTSRANSISAYEHLEPNNSNQFVLLEDLTSGQIPGIVVGDKHFDDFFYSSLGDLPDASQVRVFGLERNGHFGVRFQVSFFDLFDDGAPLSSDALIEFNVRVEDPERFLISDVHLFGNPSISNPANGEVINAFAEVVETVSGDFGTLKLSIQDDLDGFVGEAWIDPLPNPVQTLRVSKDIQLLSLIEDGVSRRATISQVDQTFSQIEVPEPATFGLVGLALLGMVVTKREF